MRFQCPHPGCNRSYVRKEHLSRHQKDHSNLREFSCEQCAGSFNRKDLLNRHISLSHSTTRPRTSGNPNHPDEEQTAGPVTQIEIAQEVSLFPPEDGIWPPTALTNPVFYDAVYRTTLQDMYFQHFHPHWPILHQQTYRTTRQSPDLERCVLVAGLWMAGAHQEEAKRQHESLRRSLNLELTIPLDLFKKIPRELGPQNLSALQALLIPLILCTYGGAATIGQTIVSIKHLFLAMEYAGIYEQTNLDSANLSLIVEEQYRRLALVHFKTFIHINTMFTENFGMFKPFEYLHASKLRIYAPLPLAAWSASSLPSIPSSDQRLLVSDLFENGISAACFYGQIGPLIAWDFATGMILGCFISRQPDESYAAVLKRARPFLFMHKIHMADNGDEEQTT